MKKIVIEQLRKCSYISGKMKTWISELNDERVYELYLRLKAGENSRLIARTVLTWDVNISSIHSAAQGISKFKKRISHLLLTPTYAYSEDVHINSEDFSDEPTLKRMERMAQDIEVRIKRLMTEEKETGIKYPLSRDIQSLASLRKAIIKQRDWELTHGDSIEAEKKLHLEKDIKKKFDKVMNYLGEDGQERLQGMILRFLELAEQHAVTMVRNDEGKYVLVEENPAIRQADNLKNSVKR